MSSEIMIPVRDEVLTKSSDARLFDNLTTNSYWFYLFVAEFLLGLGVSGFIWILEMVKNFLPKPPKNISENVVLITGATSALGTALAEEFASNNCTVICVDGPNSEVKELACKLRTRYPQKIETISPRYQVKQDRENNYKPKDPTAIGYSCNLANQEEIKNLAEKLRSDQIKTLDVLITCLGQNKSDTVFDSFSKTLMSHYWTVLAFLPAMLLREKAHVIGITPTSSKEEAHLGSKAAVSGLMEALSEQFEGRSGSKINFMTIAPSADPCLSNRSEQRLAKDIVESVKRDLSFLPTRWYTKLGYNMSCKMYGVITRITNWFHT